MDTRRYEVRTGEEHALLPPTLDRIEEVDRLTVAFAGTPTDRAVQICDEYGGKDQGWTVEGIRGDTPLTKRQFAGRLAEALFGVTGDAGSLRWDVLVEAYVDFTGAGGDASGVQQIISALYKTFQSPQASADQTTRKA